jgi:hypothetical protein
MDGSKKRSVFAEDLRAMQQTAAQAMTDYSPGGVRVPDGVYTAKQSCELRKTDAGKLRIARTFVPTEGDQQGLQIWDGLTLTDNPVGLQFARRWMEQHGYDWPEDDLAKVETIVNEINAANKTVKIRARTKNDFTNVTVMEIIEDGGESGTPEQTEPAAEASTDDLAGLDRKALKKMVADDPDLIAVIKVTASMSDDDIRERIREVRAANAVDQPKSDPEADQLREFAVEHGLDGIDDSMSADEIKAKILEDYEFKDEDLTKEERDFLNEHDLGGAIKKTAPAPKKPVAKPVSKKKGR